jgi:thiol-disulfide isomerase/thioredoxin
MPDATPPPSDSAPDTPGASRTSNATSLAVAIHEAIRPGAAPPAAPAPSSSDPPEDETLGEARVFPKWLTRGAPTLLLLAVSLASLFKLSDVGRDPPPPVHPPDTDADADPSAPPHTTTTGDEPPAPALILPSELSRGISVRNLLDLELEQVRPPAPPSFIKLGRALAKNTPNVTVLNAWATWCEPCKRELPDLREMFLKNSDTWNQRVRFVSVLSQDTIDPIEAHRRFADAMPAADAFLAEVRANALAEALRRDQAITGEGLPIWVLLDCHRERRFAHVGALQPGDFEALQRKIDQLEAELDTPFCGDRRPQRPKSPRASAPTPAAESDTDPQKAPDPTITAPQTPPTPPPSGPTCGDGVCQRSSSAEDCHRCPEDCPCAVGTCQARADGTYHCHRGLM